MSLLRQMVLEQRAVKQAAMQKKAFTAVELGVAAPLMAATGYGAYRTAKRQVDNPNARKRGLVGTGIGGAAGAALPVLLSLLTKGRVKRSLGGSAAAGTLGAAAGNVIGTWTAPDNAQQPQQK